ncbi:envelope stress response membrane protein PspB [Pseudomaricurvus alkylphenolicus]|jgi:phage shock protein B|uniref:envelope stress response membrane protein PspB n=1 Tax=Pseudomaricurvus alkylphenolicus TaxID=1306991 RepID=UPI001422A943|nr:envelope stress response membrane protein PspB [Pseudomaricurvus alkylphenolicus]NIB43912.1 envelope stress response membrane protein PspB [Pseudomaricurvus alkylphenolicus]
MYNFMFVPTILFLTIVAPLWIIMHYQSKKRSSKALSDEERQTIEDMLETVDRMAERIETLESILDDSHPRWRQQHSARSEDKVSPLKRTGGQ